VAAVLPHLPDSCQGCGAPIPPGRFRCDACNAGTDRLRAALRLTEPVAEALAATIVEVAIAVHGRTQAGADAALAELDVILGRLDS
jgi:predicted nucleic acid-binding Zn ribbon protein